MQARAERGRARAFRTESRTAARERARSERKAEIAGRRRERGDRGAKPGEATGAKADGATGPSLAAAQPQDDRGTVLAAPAASTRAVAAGAAAGAAAASRDSDPRPPPDAPSGPVSAPGPGPISQPGIAPERSVQEQAVRAAAEEEALRKLRDAERREDEARISVEKRKVEADADRRISEVERMRREAEQRLERARHAGDRGAVETPAAPAAGPTYDTLLAEFAAAERQAERDRLRDDSTRRELEDVEERLNEDQARAMEALDAAGRRMQVVEDRAAEAEARAQRAERLAELKAAEIERAQRLRQMLERVGDAERRVFDAEARAEGAVKAISSMDVPIERPAGDPPRPKSSGGRSAVPKPRNEEAAGTLSLNSATYEELRSLGLSVAETGRLLAERERMGGFRSLDELGSIRGLPRTLIDELGDKITI